MNQDTVSTARTLIADGKGILAADETPGTLTESVRRARHPLHRAEPARVSGTAVHGARRRDLDQWRHHAGRDDQTEELHGDPARAGAREPGHRAGNQGRYRRETAGARAGRDHHRGARRAPRSSRGIPRHGRALREMAGRDPHRRRAAEPRLRERERPCAGAICRALSGSEPRPDRRAGSVDGRLALDRALRRGHRPWCCTPCSRLSSSSGSRSTPCCSSPTWSSRARRARVPRPCRRSRRRRCAACSGPCRRRCPASCSCRAVRATGWPPPI